MVFRVEGDRSESDRIVRIDRPLGLIGQAPNSQIRLGGPGVNGHHVYLHLDPRGVLAVDLVSRTGTRFNGTDQPVGWLKPGDWLEIDGRRIELVEIRIDDKVVDPIPCEDDPLAELASSPLVNVSLEPTHGRGQPWYVHSELIFLGWSNACGIQINDSTAAKVHCALFRTRTQAFLIDLCGYRTRVNDQTIREASPLNNGDTISVGNSGFTVHVSSDSKSTILARLRREPLIAQIIQAEPEESDDAKVLKPLPSQSSEAILAWMVNAIQQTQDTVLHQQGEMQTALMEMLRQIQQSNATLLNSHLERVERIENEVKVIREKLTERSIPLPPQLAPPQAIPFQIERKPPGPVDPQASTSWLLDRVSQLEVENRSAWKDLLARLTSRPDRKP